jgi:hypothetical protein
VLPPAEHAMEITGSVADWEDWIGMALPESGDYVVPEALTPITVDREADTLRYVESGSGWKDWIGMALPESGDYVVPEA